MAGSGEMWADLSSQNERVIQLSESTAGPAGYPGGAARARWAALASQRERLVDHTDPEFGLADSSYASSDHASSDHASTGMRLVAGAA